MLSNKIRDNAKSLNRKVVKIKVKYSDGNIVIVRVNDIINYNDFIKILRDKINIVTLDGSRIRVEDLIVYDIRNNKEFIYNDMKYILSHQNIIFHARKQKKPINSFDFSKYGEREYLVRLVNSYDTNFDANISENWIKSAKLFIDRYLYKCISSNENDSSITSYCLSLFYIFYKQFNSNKLYMAILRIIKSYKIYKDILITYIYNICEIYRYEVENVGIIKDKILDDKLLHSICFISVYQTDMKMKWDGDEIKNIVDKLSSLKSILSPELYTYYSIFKIYLIFYDPDVNLVEQLPIIPTNEEIHCSEDLILGMLRENKLEGYKSVKEYLITHYLLLRADVLLPLQQTVNVF